MKEVVVYTDGSTWPKNPGRGGFAAILRYQGWEKVVSGSIKQSTNNISELTAILEGLRAIKIPCQVKIVTDCNLAIGWLAHNWKRKDPDCAHLCAMIDNTIKEKHLIVQFEHVHGHTGHIQNEMCDRLAKAAARS